VRNAVLGQKCSALSRLQVPKSLWTPQGGFKDQLFSDIAKIKVGLQTEWSTFVGPVIGRAAYDRIMGYISKAKEQGGEDLIGGTGDDSTGYFIQPTVILTKDPQSVTMTDEIFGSVLTVYVYPDEEFEHTVDLIDRTGQYALTGSMYVFISLCNCFL
jgi:1-pyrroline-5-carboxylate dehydrogenase